jgi:hypothetical protein
MYSYYTIGGVGDIGIICTGNSNRWLISFIQAPRQFIPECLQKIIFIHPDKVNAKFFFLYCQLNFFGYHYPAAVECTDYRICAPFYIK